MYGFTDIEGLWAPKAKAMSLLVGSRGYEPQERMLHSRMATYLCVEAHAGIGRFTLLGGGVECRVEE